MKQKILTLRQLYQEGKNRLESRSVPDAGLDAWYLLEFVTGKTRADYYGNPEETIAEDLQERYLRAVEQRMERIPLQHITGEQEFMGLSFRVNEHVLIPRQDTETLAEEALGFLRPGMRILDLCTGSGCILLSLLKIGGESARGLRGVGADVSVEALKVAAQNAENLGVPAKFVESDLFAGIEGRFGLIVSNPPYIPSKVIDGLQEEVRLHDPRIALDGWEDGLHFYRRIAQESAAYLEPGGRLALEIGQDQAERVSALLEAAGFRDVYVKRDLSGNDRVVCGIYRK